MAVGRTGGLEIRANDGERGKRHDCEQFFLQPRVPLFQFFPCFCVDKRHLVYKNDNTNEFVEVSESCGGT